MAKSTKPAVRSLASTHRIISKQWHPKKNGALTPRDVLPASRKRVWWLCPKGHVWDAVVYSRTLNGTGCPYCAGKKASRDNCLAARYPKVAREWHKEKNGKLTPRNITYGSKKKVWWRCRKGHEWQAPVCDRTSGKGCPACAHRKLTGDNNLEALRPTVAAEWHPSKNRPLKPAHVFPGSAHRIWWKCEQNHVWQATINSRTTLGTGCPYCSGRKVSKERSLVRLGRGIARQWHKTRNGDLTAFDVSTVSKRVVWWVCPKGHEWTASVRSRTQKGRRCPICYPPDYKI